MPGSAMRSVLGGLAVFAVVGACSRSIEGATTASSDRSVITQTQFGEYHFNSAYDAVASLRANWMNTKGPDSFSHPSVVRVYLDNVFLGDTATLEDDSRDEHRVHEVLRRHRGVGALGPRPRRWRDLRLDAANGRRSETMTDRILAYVTVIAIVFVSSSIAAQNVAPPYANAIVVVRDDDEHTRVRFALGFGRTRGADLREREGFCRRRSRSKRSARRRRARHGNGPARRRRTRHHRASRW